MARPVVTTSTGNEGMDAGSEQEAIVADDPRAFADAVIRIQANPELRRTLGRQGRVWVEEQFGIGVVRAQLRQTLDGVAGHTPP